MYLLSETALNWFLRLKQTKMSFWCLLVCLSLLASISYQTADLLAEHSTEWFPPP